MKRLALAATTLALLAVPVLANGSETFRAQGNEPSWSIRMSDGAMTFQPMDGEAVTVKPIPTPRQDGTTDIYEAKVGADSFALSVASKICTDTMSGMPFPKSVTVALGAKPSTAAAGSLQHFCRANGTSPRSMASRPSLDQRPRSASRPMERSTATPRATGSSAATR